VTVTSVVCYLNTHLKLFFACYLLHNRFIASAEESGQNIVSHMLSQWLECVRANSHAYCIVSVMQYACSTFIAIHSGSLLCSVMLYIYHGIL
jgi:hypothetical protein